MVQKNVSLGMVVVVALIVSVVASVATLAITGNTINVASGNAGVVYTKTEVDSMIKNAVLSFYKKTEIDSMFGNYYPKSQVESLIANAIANFYTKAEIDSKLASLVAMDSKACSGDNICEATSLKTNQITVGTTWPKMVSISGDGITNTPRITLNSPLNSTAGYYVCADSAGTLYKKATPCA